MGGPKWAPGNGMGSGGDEWREGWGMPGGDMAYLVCDRGRRWRRREGKGGKEQAKEKKAFSSVEIRGENSYPRGMKNECFREGERKMTSFQRSSKLYNLYNVIPRDVYILKDRFK